MIVSRAGAPGAAHNRRGSRQQVQQQRSETVFFSPGPLVLGCLTWDVLTGLGQLPTGSVCEDILFGPACQIKCHPRWQKLKALFGHCGPAFTCKHHVEPLF